MSVQFPANARARISFSWKTLAIIKPRSRRWSARCLRSSRSDRLADKRSRLQVVAPYIKNGTVLFPRTGCEQLLVQLFNLGVESHDDLVDGVTLLLQGLVEQGLELPKIHWIET